jgi:hypothetical protein
MNAAHHRNSPGNTAPQPFWQRLRSIALYPFRGPALYSLVALSLCTLLGLLPGVIGLILTLVVWVAIYRYSFEILRETAHGRLQSPEHTLGSSDGAVIRLMVLVILMIIAVVAAFILGGPVLGLLAMLVIVFLQPGCIISLALDGSLRVALNPATSIGLATRIGWPYLAAFGLLFVIQASAATAARWITHLPPVIGDLGLAFATIWGLFAAFHLMGYLVYQYHDVLGFTPDGPVESLRRPDMDQPLLDQAEQAVRDGELDTALTTLRAAVRTRAVSLPVHELYQRLLQRQEDSAELREHTNQYINRLVMEKQERKALGLLREALDKDPDFVTSIPELAGQLVERARLGGQQQLVCDALLAMIKAWPRAPQNPEWSLQAALLLSERYGRDVQARQLIEAALSRSDDPEQQRRLQAARDALPASAM